jgi:hypothetical protein
MQAVWDWLGTIGAEITELTIAIGTLAAGVAAGIYASRRSGRRWIGWAIGIAVSAVLVLVFGSTYQTVRKMACRTDYLACIYDEPDQP